MFFKEHLERFVCEIHESYECSSNQAITATNPYQWSINHLLDMCNFDLLFQTSRETKKKGKIQAMKWKFKSIGKKRREELHAVCGLEKTKRSGPLAVESLKVSRSFF